MQKKSEKFSLYVHIPFCVKKCLFCSFAVSVGQAHRADDYIDALENEMRPYKGATLKTVYLGGGTPTFLSDAQLQRLTNIVRQNFIVAPDVPWSIEANPEGIDERRALLLKNLGVTRVSMGVQSFNDAYLRFLGRAHDRLQALRAFEALRGAGFDNINVDLMYGFPGQSRDELWADLQAVAALPSEHVSVYTLTIEPNSRFYARQVKLDGDEKLADDYVFVAEFLENAGLKQYEVSNFARPGFESAHNTVYWEGGDYIGLGMGAHSLMGNERFWNVSTLNDYLQKIAGEGRAVEGREALSAQTRLTERLVFGLRMNRGVSIPIIEKAAGAVLPPEGKKLIDDLVEEGLLSREGDRVKATVRGRLVLDEIASRLV